MTVIAATSSSLQRHDTISSSLRVITTQHRLSATRSLFAHWLITTPLLHHCAYCDHHLGSSVTSSTHTDCGGASSLQQSRCCSEGLQKQEVPSLRHPVTSRGVGRSTSPGFSVDRRPLGFVVGTLAFAAVRSGHGLLSLPHFLLEWHLHAVNFGCEADRKVNP